MDGRSLSFKPTKDGAVSYLTAVKEAFHDEPAKFKEFFNILNGFKTHRMYKDSGIARMTELMKGHPKLLLGLSVFLPKAKTTIPTKASKGLGQSQTLVCIRVLPELIKLHAPGYIASVKEAFHNEPAKFEEWTKIFQDFKVQRVDQASTIARLEGLMKNHRNLLLGFSVFLSPGTKITIPPEAEQHIESDNNKREHAKITIPPEAEKHIASDNNKRKRKRVKIIIPPEAEQHIDFTKRRHFDPDYDPDFAKKLKSPPSKKRKRKEKNVTPPKKKVKPSKRTIHCKKCGQEGHNARSCGKRALQVVEVVDRK